MSSSRPRSNGRSNGAAPPPQANGNAFVDAPLRGPPTSAPSADLASPAGASTMGPAMPYPAHASSSYAPSARGNGAAPGSAAAGGPWSLNRSGSLRLDSLRHFAGLLVAEKPLDAHRQYQRAHTDGAGTPRTPPTAAAAAPAAAHVPAPTRAPEAPLEAIEVSDNAEYEAFRRKFKTGRLYTVVRNQIMKNKRRRGRAGYLEHLKGLYNGIVPSSGRTAPRPLPPARRALSLAYLACMLAFDFATPLLLTVNASLVTAFLAVCVTFASLFAAGLYPAWLVETQLRLADVERAAALEVRSPARSAHAPAFAQPGSAAFGAATCVCCCSTEAAWRTGLLEARGLYGGATVQAVRADVAGGEKLWGPQRLWRRYVRAGDAFGGGLYMAEWGAVGAAVVDASGEAWRYIASTFVHISFKHFIILGVAFMVSAALVERRCDPRRRAALRVESAACACTYLCGRVARHLVGVHSAYARHLRAFACIPCVARKCPQERPPGRARS